MIQHLIQSWLLINRFLTRFLEFSSELFSSIHQTMYLERRLGAAMCLHWSSYHFSIHAWLRLMICTPIDSPSTCIARHPSTGQCRITSHRCYAAGLLLSVKRFCCEHYLLRDCLLSLPNTRLIFFFYLITLQYIYRCVLSFFAVGMSNTGGWGFFYFWLLFSTLTLCGTAVSRVLAYSLPTIDMAQSLG